MMSNVTGKVNYCSSNVGFILQRLKLMVMPGCSGQPKLCWGKQVVRSGCPRSSIIINSP